MSITIFFSPSNFYFLAFPGSYTCPKSYGHHFPVRRNTFKRQGLVWRLPNRHLHRESFHIKCDFSACAVNLLIFLFGCAAYGLLFKQTRALRSNSVFKAIAMLAKPAKICQRSALTSGEICTLIMEGDWSVQIVCSTLLAVSFVEMYARQKEIRSFIGLKFVSFAKIPTFT